MKAAHPVFSLLVLSSALAASALSQQPETKPVVTPAPPQTAPADTSAQLPAAPKGTVDPDYVIGAGDNLAVNVFNEPKFSGPALVRPDGVISIPLLGDVPAAGLTPTQLGEEITSRLKKLITDPAVTVTVNGIGSKRIYMVGEIGKVGPLPMTPGMDPLQAISTAGGPGAYANIKHIYILRTVGGKKQKIPFNYKKAVKDGDMQGITLISGDTIVIP